jgi:hypothetical protein
MKVKIIRGTHTDEVLQKCYHYILATYRKEKLKMENKIISCTEAGKLLNKSKLEVRKMVEQGLLKNLGNEYRYMVSEKEVINLQK